MKKILALLLCLVLGTALGAGAFAAGTNQATGSITITNAVPNAEYNAYRMFDLTYNDITGSYSYTVTEKWRGFTEQDAISGPLGYINTQTVGDKTYVTWKKGTGGEGHTPNAAEFAKLALAYAKNAAHPIAPDSMAIGLEHGGECTADFFDLPHGYYLVDTSVGSLCMLDSTQPFFVAADKNVAPELEKKVQEDGVWFCENSAFIGDTVKFRVQITVGKGAENYVVRDTYGKGLKFLRVTGVTRTTQTDPYNEQPVDAGNYHVSETASERTFSVSFDNAYLATLAPSDVLRVYYEAELTDQAEIRTTQTDSNKNTAYLEYGHNTKVLETAKSSTLTRTWDFKIFKYATIDCIKFPLKDALFSLHLYQLDGELISFVPTQRQGTYKVCTKNDSADGHRHVTEISSGEDGMIHIEGLGSASFVLEETKAPDGYNKLKEPVNITIYSNGEVSENSQPRPDITVEIENKAGTELPSTGGIGTKWFYLTGAAMAAGAAVMFCLKKKKETDA